MGLLTEPLLSLSRRRWRTSLSALGVAAGVFAMELVASVAQHFTATAEHFERHFLHRIFVCEKVSFWAGGGILSDAKVDQVAALRGVQAAIPVLIGRIFTDRMVVLGVPPVLVGAPPEGTRSLLGDAELATGRWLSPQDADGLILGAGVAGTLHAGVGESVTLLKTAFVVRGILKPTGDFIDQQALGPLKRVQQALGREGLVTDIVVEPVPGLGAEDLGRSIQEAVHGVQVITPDRLAQEVRDSVRTWDAVAGILGWAGALAGGSCIGLVMVVSVFERTSEIGIRRAIGASSGQVFGDLLGEAVVLSVLGWIGGTLALIVIVVGSQPSLQAMGTSIFSVTPTLVLRALAATLLLGALAGLLPAWMAARLDPIAAIRRG